MSLLAVRDLVKSFGGSLIFEDVSFEIQDGELVGIVGPNGSGKSTLCALLLGTEQPDSGEIMMRRGASLGYLAQENRFEADHGAYAEAMTAFADVFRLEEEMRELETRMAEGGDDLERLLARHARLQEDYERAEGWSIHARVEAVLLGLGLERRHLEQPVRQLSGGESSRVALAKLLLREPDFLILDEPTNHLDIAGCEWLEDYLGKHRGACLLVSHDRRFLDRVTSRTLEVAAGGVTDYPAPYSGYEERKAEEFRRAREEFKEQRDFLRRERDFIRKNMGSQRTREAKGRLKRLERMERLEAPTQENLEMRVSVSAGRRLGTEILECRDLTLGYDDAPPLLSHLDLRLEPGDRLGVVGPNGAGKTSLLKAVLGRLEPRAGALEMGKTVEIGYFDQLQAEVDPTISPYDLIAGDQVRMTDLEIRSHLARFLFREEDVHRPAGSFSGGERAKIALARLLLTRPNVLVLDEPTNHLDIPSRKALETLLDEYDGVIITVSHDRYFLDRICNRILWIEKGRHRLAAGRFSAFRDRQLAEAGVAQRRREEEAAERKSREKEERRLQEARRGLERKPRRRPLAELEEAIMAAEARREAIHEEMARPEVCRDAALMIRLQEELGDLERSLGELEEEWSGWA